MKHNSPFGDYELTFIVGKGGWEWSGGGPTRAVVKLKKDISKEMAVIARAIPTVAYSPTIPVASFRYHNWRVIINKREIWIKDIAKEEDAAEVMEYLKKITNANNVNITSRRNKNE